ncbi:MAG: hypothetical protein IT427_14415 [Pirellulales bacterium]|nr:hypothetical protein [Pirellulales bacterium]
MFDWLVILVVAAHFLAVNLAAAGPIVSPLVEWHGTRRGQLALVAAALRLAQWSIVAAGIGFGLGLLAMAAVTIWHPDGDATYLTAVKQVTPSRWWFTAGEVGFYFVCMGAYVVLWPRLERFRLAHRFIALAAGMNLLYHFPALFTMISILIERPALHGRVLDRRLYLQLLFDSETLARVTHVWLASLAAAGLALAWIAERLGRQSRVENVLSVVTLGGRIALAATLLQVPVGVWVLVTLPESQQQRVMGGDLACSALFGASVIAALALMQQLAMLSLGDATKKRIRSTALLMAVVVFLMTATLQLARG